MKLSDIAQIIDGKVVGDASLDIVGVNAIESAKENEATFISNPKYAKFLSQTKAGCVIVDSSFDISDYKNNFIVCDDAYLGFARVLRYFYKRDIPNPYKSEKAHIAENADIDGSSYISDFVFIDEGAVIGKSVMLMPFVFVGKNSVIGDNCIVYPHTVIRENCIIGNNVILHAGSVVGSDGFGYAHTKEGEHIKIPQIGNVVIEDDVEIGANCTIDRAALGSTTIKKGSKIDNLVQIAHNVEIGENSIIVAQTGISGSSKIGKNVILAGQSGVAGHITIADGTIITAQSGVGSNIKKRGVFSGTPVYEHSKWLRSSVVMPKLSEMYKKILELEKEIEELKK